MFTASELFELALRVEENGERFYRDALNKTKPGLVKDLFVWLADQEVAHKNTFAQIKEMVAGQTERDPALIPVGRDVLVGAMGRHAFSLDELEIDSIRGEEEILRAALDFEEDTLIFFDFISPFVSDQSVRALLDTIKAEEHHHKEVLRDKIAAIQSSPAKGP